jgi:protein-disulfide isomerase
MKVLSKMFFIAGLAAFVPAPVFAQSADMIKQGDYYAPTQTVVQHATAQELNEFRHGDFYAPSQTAVQQSTAQEMNQAREGGFYAPVAGE